MEIKSKLTTLICLVICVIFLFSKSYNVTASTTNVNISLDAGIGFTDTLSLVFEEIKSLETYEVILTNENSYNIDVLLKQGTYKLKSYKCHGTNTAYIVTFNDFDVNSESKDKLYVRGNIRLNVDDIGNNDYNLNSDINSNHTDKSTEESTTVIEKNNKYFPEKTFNEIAQWYVDSIKEYLDKGLENKTIIDFTNSVDIWCEMVIKQKSNNVLSLKYKTQVERYISDKYPNEIYETQYKMYNFIRDYFTTHKKFIQFKWTEIDIVQPDVSSDDTNIDKIIGSPTPIPSQITETPMPIKSEQSLSDKNENKLSLKDKALSVFWDAKFTLLIFIVVIIGAVIFKIKYMKES